MLIGAHVSISGGLDKAVERGSERGCNAIQIFSQSPRAWRPNNYDDDDFVAFRNAIDGSDVDSVVIHALYLANCASDDKDLWQKSVKALTHSVGVGDSIGAAGVVLHPGNQKEQTYLDAIKSIGRALKQVLSETENCRILLENSGGKKAIGKRFEELADLLELVGGDPRVGICLDSCHSLVAGYDVRDASRLAEVLEQFDATVGLDRLRCIHLNDSKAPLGSYLDRHENIGDGELGRAAIAAWLSEPRFDGLPVVMETPGPDGKGTDAAQVTLAKMLRVEGLANR